MFYRQLEQANIPAFIQRIQTLKNWQIEILNSFVFDHSNGFLEGINNKSKMLKRNAYGFRKYDHFRAKILLGHMYKEMDGWAGKEGTYTRHSSILSDVTATFDKGPL